MIWNPAREGCKGAHKHESLPAIVRLAAARAPGLIPWVLTNLGHQPLDIRGDSSSPLPHCNSLPAPLEICLPCNLLTHKQLNRGAYLPCNLQEKFQLSIKGWYKDNRSNCMNISRQTASWRLRQSCPSSPVELNICKRNSAEKVIEARCCLKAASSSTPIASFTVGSGPLYHQAAHGQPTSNNSDICITLLDHT